MELAPWHLYTGGTYNPGFTVGMPHFLTYIMYVC